MPKHWEPSPEKYSKLAKSMQQYNLTYSGRVPIKRIHPFDFTFYFFNHESQLINLRLAHTGQRKDCHVKVKATQF